MLFVFPHIFSLNKYSIHKKTNCINIINANSSTLDELKKIVNERNVLINANNARNKAMNKLLNKINKYNNSDGMKR